MHDSPARKFIEHTVKQDIKENGLDAEVKGTFYDDYDDELYFGNNEEDNAYLVDYVYYNIYNDKQYGKCCHLEVYFKDGNKYSVDTEYDNVYDDLTQNLENEDTAWDITSAIDNNRGIERNGQLYYSVNEVNENTFDVNKFLNARYEPTNDEINDAVQSTTDNGRFWKYDKIICFWSTIPNTYLQTMLDELTEATGIDFSDYRIVYEDENTEEVIQNTSQIHVKIKQCTICQHKKNGMQLPLGVI